jgi:hypothetical protein
METNDANREEFKVIIQYYQENQPSKTDQVSKFLKTATNQSTEELLTAFCKKFPEAAHLVDQNQKSESQDTKNNPQQVDTLHLPAPVQACNNKNQKALKNTEGGKMTTRIRAGTPPKQHIMKTTRSRKVRSNNKKKKIVRSKAKPTKKTKKNLKKGKNIDEDSEKKKQASSRKKQNTQRSKNKPLAQKESRRDDISTIEDDDDDMDFITTLAAATDKAEQDLVVVAMQDYEASDGSELALAINDSVRVTQKDTSGWWYGQNLRTKKWGHFPKAHIKQNVSI